MKTFSLVISSPDGEIFREDVTKISLRGTLGDLAIMAGHIPFVTAVKPGDISIEKESGDTVIASVEGGILSVSADKVNLLAGVFNWK